MAEPISVWKMGQQVEFIKPQNSQFEGTWVIVKILAKSLHVEKNDVTIKRVAFNKVRVPVADAAAVPQNPVACAHCTQPINTATHWNTASSCCTRACSDQLKRVCPECKKEWTRASSTCDYFCSSACADEMNRKSGFVYCPMFL